GLQPCEQHPLPHLYDIPLRSCISRDIENLMFAGRNHSATHVAFSSTRVMATCAVMGQGVGTAAALAVDAKVSPSEISSQTELINSIQQQLLCDDAFLIDRANNKATDLIHHATLSSSSEQTGGEATNISSTQTRSVHGERGASKQRSHPGTHRWMSDPSDGFPAALEITWSEPVHVSQIHLVFDTGLHRHLTLSQLDAYSDSMIWGKAQPETIRDYSIKTFNGKQWTHLLDVTGNYQRKRVHEFDPLSLSAIRIFITATNGLDHARICQARVY
ncbi:MAG: FAD-dependent oxidoreductase, partial [Verrucomicrobia bacterium]|nr:FAD-dependent oxidoreductase [Verrucomicrobiota bacterium]